MNSIIIKGKESIILIKYKSEFKFIKLYTEHLHLVENFKWYYSNGLIYTTKDDKRYYMGKIILQIENGRVFHKDKDKLNFHIDNLEINLPKQKKITNIRSMKKKKYKVHELDKNIINIFSTLQEIINYYDVKRGTFYNWLRIMDPNRTRIERLKNLYIEPISS
jgi:hypothetical protein